MEIDLRVEGRGGQILMAKDLADRHQASASAQQLTCQGMPEPVWPHRWQADADAGSLDDIADQVSTDRSARGTTGQEQAAGTL